MKAKPEGADGTWLTRPFIALVKIALALGLALRLWHVFAEPLWLDEAYSAFAADHDFAFLWRVVPRYETHPPFYYSLLHLWVLAAGDGLAVLRLPGIMAGLATLPVITLAAGEAGRLLGWERLRRTLLAAAGFALACVAIELVEMTRQVRPYPLMILAYAAATWALLRIRGRGPERRLLLGHFALLEAMLWLHSLGPLYGVALTVALLLALRWRMLTPMDWAWLVLGHLTVAVLYLPGLLIMLDQAPTWVGSTWLALTPGNVIGHFGVLYAAPGPPALAAIGLAAMAMAGAGRWRGGPRLVALLALLAFGPVVLALILSITVAPLFITRVFSPCAVPVLLLYALGIAAWDGWRRWLGIALALWLGANMAWAGLLTRHAGPMQDWYGAVDWLRTHVGPGDRVLAYPNEGALPLGFALRDRRLAVAIEPIPAPMPAVATPGASYAGGSRGVVALTPRRLISVANRPELRAVPTIWLLRLGAPTYDPGDTLLRLLRRERMVVAGWRSGPIELTGLRRAAALNRPAPARQPPPP